MADSPPQGFLAVPPTGKGPGVLVLHAWWGLNDTIKAFCTQLAASGFVAFAPDLYHGKVADNVADAETLGTALDLAAADPEHIRSVVIFYGTGGGDFSNSRAAYLGHFAENDEFEPQSNVDNLEEALRGAGRPVTFYRYPDTGHWFFEPDRSQAYNQAAASLAWDRTLAFLKSGMSGCASSC